MSKDFFLNILIVLVPVLLYQVIHDRSFHKTVKRSPWIIGVLGGVSAILCVKFPFIDGYGVWWDFRAIPLILAMVYGGYGAGALALAMEVAFRAYLGGSGALFSILFTCAYMILPSLMVKRFYRFSFKRRMVTCIVLSFLAYLTLLTVVWLNFRLFTQLSFEIVALEKVAFVLMIGLLQAMTMALSVWLIENMILTHQLRAELQRSEKLSIISELAASVAHEIRNPLTVVRGFLQLLGGSVDPKKQQYMQTAIAELDRAEFIISDYLNFAKPQIESLTLFNAAKPLEDVVTLMTSLAMLKGVRIEQQIHENLWLHANQDKLKQAMINLLKNAIEACSGGGEVLLLAKRYERRVLIQVIDTGVGMTASQVERLGHPFYSTKDKGTGLGLMVTFRIIESMNGKLTFQSEKGRGTNAIIQFPSSLSLTDSQDDQKRVNA